MQIGINFVCLDDISLKFERKVAFLHAFANLEDKWGEKVAYLHFPENIP